MSRSPRTIPNALLLVSIPVLVGCTSAPAPSLARIPDTAWVAAVDSAGTTRWWTAVDGMSVAHDVLVEGDDYVVVGARGQMTEPRSPVLALGRRGPTGPIVLSGTVLDRIASGVAYSVERQPDGALWVTGEALTPQGNGAMFVARIVIGESSTLRFVGEDIAGESGLLVTTRERRFLIGYRYETPRAPRALLVMGLGADGSKDWEAAFTDVGKLVAACPLAEGGVAILTHSRGVLGVSIVDPSGVRSRSFDPGLRTSMFRGAVRASPDGGLDIAVSRPAGGDWTAMRGVVPRLDRREPRVSWSELAGRCLARCALRRSEGLIAGGSSLLDDRFAHVAVLVEHGGVVQRIGPLPFPHSQVLSGELTADGALVCGVGGEVTVVLY